MAQALFNQSLAGQFGLKARFQKLRDTFDAHAKRRAVYSRTVRELHALSDRDLADLGMHRSEIPRIAQDAADVA